MLAGSFVEFMWWSFLFSLVFFPAALILAYVPDRTAMMTA
jgi:hypothetical protein